MNLDHSKFSIAQMTSNSNGKTSGSGTMGVLMCTVGTLCFLIGCIDKVFISKDVDVITQSIVFVGIGTALLGYRKSKDNTESLEILSKQIQSNSPSTTCATCSSEPCVCDQLKS
jgi:hypothetical protein